MALLFIFHPVLLVQTELTSCSCKRKFQISNLLLIPYALSCTISSKIYFIYLSSMHLKICNPCLLKRQTFWGAIVTQIYLSQVMDDFDTKMTLCYISSLCQTTYQLKSSSTDFLLPSLSTGLNILLFSLSNWTSCEALMPCSGIRCFFYIKIFFPPPHPFVYSGDIEFLHV